MVGPLTILTSKLCLAANMALLTDFQTLAMITSVGTLFVTGMVSASLLFHRYHMQGTGSRWPALGRLLCVVTGSFGKHRGLVDPGH